MKNNFFKWLIYLICVVILSFIITEIEQCQFDNSTNKVGEEVGIQEQEKEWEGVDDKELNNTNNINKTNNTKEDFFYNFLCKQEKELKDSSDMWIIIIIVLVVILISLFIILIYFIRNRDKN